MGFVCKLNSRGSDSLIKRVITRLSEISLGIYFSHSLLMWAIGEKINVGNIHLDIGSSVIECLAFVVIVFVGTVIIIIPLMNIPYLKKLVKIS